jgi:two-component system phosphate regulon sensor histidine kinase PhoR
MKPFALLTSPLFRRLFLPYFIVICCCVAALGMLGAQRLRSTYIASVEQRLRENSLLIARLLNVNGATVEENVHDLGQALGCRITVIQSDGAVIADNEADPAHMENHRARPEVIAALANGQGMSVRRSDTVHAEMVYFARQIDLNHTTTVLRLSVHLKELERQLAVLYRDLATTALVAILVAAIPCYYFARQHTLPLVEVTRFADSVAHGELTRRITHSFTGEIAVLSSALNRMADSLTTLLAETRTDRARLHAILSAMSEGVIAANGQQEILLANAAAGRLLGFDPDTVIGHPLFEVLRSEDLLKSIDTALRDRERKSLQIGPINGRFLEVVLSPFKSEEHPSALVIAAHDTTEMVRYEELRKDFVANVSHELRTPITVIKGYAETLRSGAVHDHNQLERSLAIIEKHADQLGALVTDLLDLARLEAESEPTGYRRVNLAPLVHQVAELLAPAAHQKQQTLDVNVGSDSPAVVGNAEYLERAISNLVDNAIKYTPEGGAISISAARDGGHAIIEVADNGIGIPADDVPRIFERFYRVDRSRSRAMGGTGLGLSIVKHVVQSHKGTVEVTSEVGKGTRFRMILPLAPEAP